ncbi:MAG: 50S ribosomal protein L29 [Candidatus Omnitrophica bacterium]|nr:50S ribosomal protein L29 [Candidatus Omnitrophota bacterium]
MKASELRQLSREELAHKQDELKKELMELQYKRKSGVEKPHLFGQLKKDIARIHTVLKKK